MYGNLKVQFKALELTEFLNRNLLYKYTGDLHSPAGLLLGSSNPHPSHWPLPFPLDPPPIIICPANRTHLLWTLSSSPDSHHPPNPHESRWGIKISGLPSILVGWFDFQEDTKPFVFYGPEIKKCLI